MNIGSINFSPAGNYNTAQNHEPMKPFSFVQFEQAWKDLTALKDQGKWILMAPDGRIWEDKDPEAIMRVALLACSPPRTWAVAPEQ